MAWYLNSFRWWPRFKFHKIFRCVFLYAEVTVILVTTILAYSIILSFSLKLMLLPSGQYLDSCQTWYMCSSFNTLYQSQISNQFGYACANSINLYEVCNSNYLSPPMKKIIKVWQIIDYKMKFAVWYVVAIVAVSWCCMPKYKTNNSKYNYNTNIHLFVYLYMTSCSL